MDFDLASQRPLQLADYVWKLSRRQSQVWKLLAESYSSKQIAGLLGIADKTVQWHRCELRRKTKMNLAQLTREALRIGLIEL